MVNTLEAEIILNKKVHSIIKGINFIMIILVLSCLYILIEFNYITYYQTLGTIVFEEDKYYLVITNLLDNNKYIIDNNYLILDDKKYSYQVVKIKEELLSDNINNYQVIYLDVLLNKKYQVNNLLLNVKIPKDDKPIIKYFL